jgi:hypothetical protein
MRARCMVKSALIGDGRRRRTHSRRKTEIMDTSDLNRM